jgi:ligand-binding SRPBCC domain-containing protein
MFSTLTDLFGVAMAFFEYSSIIRAAVPDVFSFYNDLNNLSLISSPAVKIEVINVEGKMARGTRIEMKISRFGLAFKWLVSIQEHVPNRYFIEIQEKAPFAHWKHTHEFHRVPEGIELVDRIEYELPLFPFSWPARKLYIARKLFEIFHHRHEMTRKVLEK